MLFDGMQNMKRKAGSLKKNNSKKIIIFSFLILFIFSCNYAIAGSTYTPQAPKGPTEGNKDIEYEYSINTGEVGSQWRFYWGDSTYSEWIVVEEGDEYSTSSHSWEEYGSYDVRVQNKNIYNQESNWSPSLKVDITIPPDLDGDGFLNEVEEAYNNDPENSDDFPLDTDGDKTPDENSPDDVYTGDTDDDNDELLDIYEIMISSDSKDGSDVKTVLINGFYYFIVDLDNDGTGDLLFNSETSMQSEIAVKDASLLLDIDDDGSWDYSFLQGVLEVYVEPFEIPWLLIGATIAIIVLAVLFVLFKMGFFYVYEEEIIVEE